MAGLLFEIGCEELPPEAISNLTDQIKTNITSTLNQNYIPIPEKEIQTFSTPRRITIYISTLPAKQPIKNTKVKGPPKDKAYDSKGNFTQAALGFAKKNNINIEKLYVEKVNNVEYVFADIKLGGKDIKELLRETLPNSLKNTTGKKFMKWGDISEKFARPIRWIVALLDKEVIDFTYAGVKSSNHSFGHRFLSNKKIQITSPDAYKDELKKNYVIVSPEERKVLIKQNIANLTAQSGGIPIIEEGLLNTVVNITEYPSALLCSFDKEFLSLPPVVTETVLEKHQKYFVIKDKNKTSLLPLFIVITNGTEVNNEKIKLTVKSGNEKVARARLNDAKFFIQEDLKRPFTHEERIKDLSKITFQKGLGLMEDKVTRIIKLSEYIYKRLNAEKVKLEQSIDDVIQTAKLCKLDLSTSMVFEFTELQGEVGAIYSKESNHNNAISEGIKEHYLPRFYGDKMPKSDTGLIVGIADKIDNITCLFSIGKIPTGSVDPFALRRQAQGIIDQILYKHWKLDITNLVDVLITNFIDTKVEPDKEKSIIQFLTQRFITSMDNLKYENDLITSVVSVKDPLKDVISAQERVKTLKDSFASTNKTKYMPFLVAAKRLVRIVEKETNGGLDINKLNTNEEKILLKMFEDINKNIKSDKYKNHKEFLDELTTLTTPINTFFDNVLVNDPDPKIKKNRQSLLKKGKDLFENICDFNMITERS